MSATTPSAYEWHTLPWRTIEGQVYKLQKRIYQASRHGDLQGRPPPPTAPDAFVVGQMPGRPHASARTIREKRRLASTG